VPRRKKEPCAEYSKLRKKLQNSEAREAMLARGVDNLVAEVRRLKERERKRMRDDAARRRKTRKK